MAWGLGDKRCFKFVSTCFKFEFEVAGMITVTFVLTQ
jgi:hypothetical protein